MNSVRSVYICRIHASYFLNTYSWDVRTPFHMDGVGCADPRPYTSFDLSAASAVYMFIAVSDLLCLQSTSSFSIVIMQSASILDSSSLLLVSTPTLHPRYVASHSLGTSVLPLQCMFEIMVCCDQLTFALVEFWPISELFVFFFSYGLARCHCVC